MIRFGTMLTKYNLCIGSDPTNQNCSCKYGSITRDRLLLDVTNKNSLDLYQYFYIKQGKHVYLDNQNDFKTSRLKLHARTKTIPLQKYLCRMNLSGEMTCPLCKTDTDEELEHFLLHCPTFSSIRLNEFFKVFDSFVENQKYGLKLMELSSSAKQISWTVQQLSTTWTIFAISNMSTFVYTELSAALTTVLPVLFKCCYKYCYSDSRKL
jgi:hypothetical protein